MKSFKHFAIQAFVLRAVHPIAHLEPGNIKVANMVALGCYLGAKKIVKIKEMLEVFRSMAPAGKADILEVNQRALQEGVKLVNG